MGETAAVRIVVMRAAAEKAAAAREVAVRAASVVRRGGSSKATLTGFEQGCTHPRIHSLRRE